MILVFFFPKARKSDRKLPKIKTVHKNANMGRLEAKG